MPFENPMHDPAKRIIRFPTVQFPNSWPKAPSQYAFIYAAINLVGAAIFGSDWSGEELLAVTWIESPRAERTRARVFRPTPPVPHSLSNPRPREPVRYAPIEHVLDWKAEKLHEQWEANRSAAERLNKSVDWIAQKCRDGELRSFYRLRVGGGPVMPMSAHEWNVDIPLMTFVSNGGNNRFCRDLKSAGPFDTFVFFEKDELLNVLRREPNAPLVVSESDLSRLSPYLQGAVRLALRKGYTSRKACETNPVREAEIRGAWPDLFPGITISDNAVEAITRVIGFPDNRSIGTGLRAKAKKGGGR